MKTTPSNHTTKNLFKVGSFSSAVMIAITAFTIAGTAQISANNYTWTGGVDDDWNDAGNWDIGIPGNYQHNLIFSGTSNTATNNDIGGSFGKITFNNTTAGQSFSLGGVGLNLYGTVSTAAVVGGGTIEDTISLSLRTTAGTRTFNMGTDHNLTVSGVIHGPQGIIKTGDGELTLSAANTYFGTTTINGGTLAFAGGGTTANYIPIVINDTGTLRFDKDDTFGNANTDTSSSITVNAGGTIESNGFFTTIRDLNLNGGTVALTGGANADYPALALKGTVTVGGSQASQINYVSGNFSRISIGDNNLGATVFDVADATGDASADLTIGAVVQNNSPIGGNSLTKNGAGTMELTSTNTYTGTTTVNEGTLRMVNSTTGNAIRGSGHNYVIASGATLEADRTGGSVTSIGNFNLSGSGTFKSSGLEMTPTSAGSNVNMSSGALFHVESGRYNFGQAGLGDWSSNLSDMQVDSGATFNGAATPTVVDALNGAGTVLTGGGITVGIDNGSGSFSGVIGNSDWIATGANATPEYLSSAYSITKEGTGTQTLSGNNTYTGTTTVNEGTLRMVNSTTGNAIRGGHNYSVASGATLEFNRIGGLDSPGTFNLSGSGIFKKSGSEEIIQTSAGSNVNMGSGALFHVESGIYRFGADGIGDWSSNLSDMQVDSGATFNGAATPTVVDALNGSGTVITSGGITVGVDNGTGSFSGVITDGTHNGTPSFTKNGSGTQTLSGNNTYTGDTTVNGGTLVIDGNQASATGAMTINVNGSLAGSGTIGASLLTVKGVLAPGNSPGTLATGDQVWNDGGSYLWEINDSDGSKGLTGGGTNGWDWLDITGTLNLTNLSTGGFTINIDSLTSGNVAGNADGFGTWTKGAPGDVDYSFIIATASGGVTDFSADKFSFDSSGFSNAPGWDWQIILSGGNLVLEAYAVPEPSSTVLLGLGGLALMLRRKR